MAREVYRLKSVAKVMITFRQQLFHKKRNDVLNVLDVLSVGTSVGKCSHLARAKGINL